jgi:hypothetical protein
VDEGSGPRRSAIARAAGWPLWLAGGAALLVALSATADLPRAAAAAEAPPLPAVFLQQSGAVPGPRGVQAAGQVQDTVFRHQDHERVDCLSCHTVDPVHGEVRVRTLSDCRSCHHRAPLATDCARCHTQADVPAGTYTLPRAPELSVGRAPERLLPFNHSEHPGVACASCHTEGLPLAAAQVDCASCHQEHHVPEARCATCHLPVLETPPHPLEVHVGCAGAGCHSELPFEGVPRTRNFCVACHQQMEAHRPDGPCTNCHLLPRPSEAPAEPPPGGVARRPRPSPLRDDGAA